MIHSAPEYFFQVVVPDTDIYASRIGFGPFYRRLRMDAASQIGSGRNIDNPPIVNNGNSTFTCHALALSLRVAA